MQDTQLNTNKACIIFRMGLESWFHDTVGKAMKDIDCHYFNHQLIQKYDQERDTIISSFCLHPEWQHEYWQNHWDSDPLLQASYKITKHNGSVLSHWNSLDPDSDIMEKRKTTCNLGTGFSYWRELNNSVLEYFSCGWTKYNANQVTRKQLEKLDNMITDFRIQHYRLNGNMFDGAYPAVDFHKESGRA